MKRLFSLIFISIFSLSTQNTFALSAAQNFYFSNAEFDYYLNQSETGGSTMHVDESLTAVFPDTNQNHGIERCIPQEYRGVNSLLKSSFSVTRNGITEQFTSYKNDSLTCFRIGNANSYVHGSQTYKLSYDLENVILNPDNSEYQELYWDTNGTEWEQKFDKLTARIHLPAPLVNAWNGETSCYVGALGTSGAEATSRCETFISEDKSVITFTTTNLRSHENLTFDLPFMPNTFVVKKSNRTLIFYGLLVSLAIVFVISIFEWRKAFQKVSDKRKLAIDKVVPVQYTPPKDVTVAEAGTDYLKTTTNPHVASLIELAVHHNIALEKGEKKTFGGYHWKIHVKRLKDISEEQKIVLEVLNGGKTPKDGDVFEVKKNGKYSTHINRLMHEFDSEILSSLKSKNLFEPDKKTSNLSTLSIILLLGLFFLCGTFYFLLNKGFFASLPRSTRDLGYIIDIATPFLYIICFTSVLTTISKYNKRTMEGIKLSKYLDGLKEYMTLAEKERLKFLQSVKGVDTTHEGIVKLYEKLLPYAVLFNIEDSWLKEMNRYLEMSDVNYHPYWMYGGFYFSSRDFREFSTYANSYISSTSASSSSGSSGGGGGGFSGGGGGGGGGGGW